MGKAEAGTPKAIANAIKSKGLQKLRWYCQLCQKQCRDENGFKCHLTSESHRRQVNLFGEDPGKFIDEYSEQFEKDFLDHLRVSHPGTRVSAKQLYNEYIGNRHHVHMTSTVWHTLTEFVKYLGREGKCKVDETPKGWFMQLIQKDPFAELNEKNKRKRDYLIRSEEEDQRKQIQEQYERARKQLKEDPSERAATEFKRNENEQINLQLNFGNNNRYKEEKIQLKSEVKYSNGIKWDQEEEENNLQNQSTKDNKYFESEPHKSRMEEIFERSQQHQHKFDLKKQKQQEKQNGAQQNGASQNGREPVWILEDIVVKVLSPKLKEHGYYNKKGKITSIHKQYIAEIEMLDTQDILRVDQNELETVIPKFGQKVKILKGTNRGQLAVLEQISEEKFQGHLQIVSSSKLVWLDYDAFCKIAK